MHGERKRVLRFVKFEQVNVPTMGILLGKCIRVRIKIDITKPLCHRRFVKFGGSNSCWVSFRYERLPIFCYWCSKLNHDEKDCRIWIRSNRSLQQQDQQYGAWLRANSDRLQKPQFVKVHVMTPGKDDNTKEKWTVHNSSTDKGQRKEESPIMAMVEMDHMEAIGGMDEVEEVNVENQGGEIHESFE